ncbi:MAG: hypothetical protein IJW99_06200 [Clostridia bacterium]|nr:hypothetical protein [Clostridia bacterium]
MKNKDIERMLSESDAWMPSDGLKKRILRERVTASVKQNPEQSAYARRIRPTRLFYRMIPIAAVLITMLFCLVVGAGMYATEYETVYVDINPSIEVSVNRFSRIIGVDYLNEDAERCFSDLSLKNRSAEQGMILILDMLNEEGYLENGELYIGVSGKNEKHAEKLLTKLEEYTEKTQKEKGYSATVFTQKIAPEDKQAAKEMGISPTKYRMIKNILDENYAYSPEDLKDMKMKDLRELLGEQKHGIPEHDKDAAKNEKTEKWATQGSPGEKSQNGDVQSEKNNHEKQTASPEVTETKTTIAEKKSETSTKKQKGS